MRKFLINVNGNQYEVEVEEIIDGVAKTEPTRQAPASSPSTSAAPSPTPQAKSAPVSKQEKKEVLVSEGAEAVLAPMPGTILSVKVSEGEEVKAGDILLILEAMKMENEILAPRAGRVTSVGVAEGASVNTGDQLVVIE